MLRWTITGTALAGVALFLGSAKERVTFQHDVLPILAKHCQNCHRPRRRIPRPDQASSIACRPGLRNWFESSAPMLSAKV